MIHQLMQRRNRSSWLARTGVVVMMLGTVASVRADGAFNWTEWGGTGQDFSETVTGLSTDWPESGPPVLWSRDLGTGYSAILHEGGKLYTLYRVAEDDVVICLDAKTGKTIWEYKYASPAHSGHVMQFTAGPRSTPLLVNGRLYTASVAGIFHCLDAATGKVHWKHDLWTEFNGTTLNHGYSSSPIAYRNTVICLVGGEGNAVMAFDQKTGDVVWKRHNFTNSYSTPRLVKLDGKDQLACFMANEIVGVDPVNGDLLWSYEIGNQYGQNICLPIVDNSDNMIFFSTTSAGSRGCKLKQAGSRYDIEEKWSTRKIQLYHVTAIRVGDFVYGSSGTGSPSFFSAVNYKTGDIAWRKRGFGKATCLRADNKLIILDEDGNLAIATATPDAFTVHAKTKLMEKAAWTVPTLVNKTLYVRDLKTIKALDLG